jgi:hypothetical protein
MAPLQPFCSHRATDGEKLVVGKSSVIQASSEVEFGEKVPARLRIFRERRRVQLTERFHQTRKSDIQSGVCGKRIVTTIYRGKTLFHEPAQSATTEPGKSRIDRYDRSGLLADGFDLRVEQLETASAGFSDLPEEIELGRVREPFAEPPLIEPDDLQAAVSVVNPPVDDVQPSTRYPTHPKVRDVPSQKDPGTRFGHRIESSQTRSILIAPREVKQKVDDSRNTCGGK